MRNWKIAALLGLFLVAGATHALGPGGVRKQAEASMLVRGTLDITPDGRVSSHQLDGADKLPSGVVKLLAERIAQWQFEPVLVDNRAVPARSPMQLRLVAKRDGDNYLLRIAGATFGAPPEGEWPSSQGKLAPPRYPKEAAYAGVSGTVYLVLRVGRDGRVEDTVAEQVNLRFVASEGAMTRWRALLANAAASTAKDWKFSPPTRGEEVDAPFWSVRVPVDFTFDMKEGKAGEWLAYVPGPRQPVPWRTWDDARLSPDAVAAGGVYPDRPTGPRLLTPLGG